MRSGILELVADISDACPPKAKMETLQDEKSSIVAQKCLHNLIAALRLIFVVSFDEIALSPFTLCVRFVRYGNRALTGAVLPHFRTLGASCMIQKSVIE